MFIIIVTIIGDILSILSLLMLLYIYIWTDDLGWVNLQKKVIFHSKLLKWPNGYTMNYGETPKGTQRKSAERETSNASTYFGIRIHVV